MDVKCSLCGSKTMMRLNTNGTEPQCIYKCLNPDCGYETIVDMSNKNHNQKVIREHIDKLKKTSDIPILISNLKKIRLDANIGQKEVSDSLVVTPQRYGTIERCENIPTITTIMDIAILFNVSFDSLYTIQYISEEDYNKLRILKVGKDVSESKGKFIEDQKVLKMESKIKNYEISTGITERKIYNNKRNKDSLEIQKIKHTLQLMDAEYIKYCKKNLILKQRKVIDYYYWQDVKKILTNKY